jgi:transcriptional regulator with XRE-family HTH domain
VQRREIGSLAERVRSLRQRCGLTQEQFAEKAGMSYKYYQQIEAGRKQDLRLSTLKKIADALRIEVSELLSATLPKAVKPPKERRR